MSEVERDPLQKFADHVFNPNNVWDPEQYIQNRTMSGKLTGHCSDSSLRMQYCHGNSYAEGYLGDTAIRIFGSNLQGYQIWVFPLGLDFKEAQSTRRPLYVHPSDKDGFLKTVLMYI